jgi:predicted alpha/beta superfamily hydrolase
MRYLMFCLLLALGACADTSDDVPADGDAATDASSDAPGDAVEDGGPDDADTADTAGDADPTDATDASGDVGDAAPDTPDGADAPTDTNDTGDASDAADGDGADATPEDTVCPDGDIPDVSFSGNGRYRALPDLPLAGVPARTVTVYLPPGYDDGDERYPVLYMHDGQNLFDPRRAAFGVEWQVDETIDALVEDGAIRPWIIVGVDNSRARIDDYTATVDPDRGAGGNADAYLRALTEEIKPIVDAHFRTLCGRSNTAVAGSSLGGIVSLRAGINHADVFGRVAAVSPSLWWNSRAPLRAFEAFDGPLPLRLWLDAGSEESSREETLTNDLTRNVREVAGIARDRGLRDGVTLGTLEDQGAAHNEASWARRLPAIFLFLLGDDDFNEIPTTGLDLWVWDRTAPLGQPIAVSAEASFASGGRLTLPHTAITWSSDDPEIATVVDGNLVQHTDGTTTVHGRWRGQAASLPVGSATATLRFEVTIPGNSPDGTIYVTGDAESLGPWDPAGLALTDTGTWTGTLQLPVGAELAFKITRGTWETVEKDRNGAEIADRRWLVEGDETVVVQVARWADQ